MLWRAPAVESEFRARLAHSPVHNTRPNTRYPATLVLTGDHDVRVAPLHSYEFVAALQAAQAGRRRLAARAFLLLLVRAGGPTASEVEAHCISAVAERWRPLRFRLG